MKLWQKSHLVLILSLFFGLNVAATTFIPLPIEDQIDATDGVVLATNQGKAFKRLPTGDIVTEYTFKLELVSGLPEHEVISPNAFKILTPGGLWQGRYYQVHGVASFQQGEQSLLFLKKTPHGWVVNNLSMGKFDVSQDAEGTWFKNTVFPKHPKFGTISMNKLNDLLTQKFDTGLIPVEIDKYVHTGIKNKKSNGANRKIASIEEDEMSQGDSNNSYGLVWMMLLFGVLGFIYRVRAKKTR